MKILFKNCLIVGIEELALLILNGDCNPTAIDDYEIFPKLKGRKRMLRLMGRVIGAVAFILLFATAGFAEPCKKELISSKTEKAFGCEIVTHTGRFSNGTNSLDFSGSILSCGGQVVVDYLKQVVQESENICKDVQEQSDHSPVEYDYSMTMEFASSHKNLVSVTESVAGYTGGAHGFAYLRRVTYGKKTLHQHTINEIFGDEAASKILSAAKKKFEAIEPERRDLYGFEPNYFSVESWGNDQVKILFTAPHQIEIARGSTLDVSVIHKAPGEDMAGKPGAEGELLKGAGCIKQGRYDGAVIHFKRSIQMNPGSTIPYVQLSFVYLKKKNYTECITWGRIAESISKGNESLSAARYNIAECYRLSGNPNLACEFYRKALKVQPDNPETQKQCKTYCGGCR